MEWVIGIRSEMLTLLFKGFTLLGYSGFLFIFIPIGYWMISKRIFAQVCLLLLLSALLNAYLKDLFQDPRPDPMYHLDPHIGKSFGFPSGHAQMAVAVWLWIAWQARKNWIWVLCSVVVAGICFSRLYLGVHDLEDVLGGVGIGLLTIFIFKVVSSGRLDWRYRQSPIFSVILIISIELFFFLTWPGTIPQELMGAGILLVGFWIGVLIERYGIHFERHHDWWRVILTGVVGMLFFVLVRKGFDIVGSLLKVDTAVAAFGESFVLGIYVAAASLWIFQQFKLANRETL